MALLTPLLRVEDLRIHIDSPFGLVRAVDGVSFDLDPGEVLGVVGESGSGKTMMILAILRLLPSQARIVSGRILFHGRDILAMSPSELTRMRGAQIAAIPQDPLTSLNPVLTVGRQITESLALKYSEANPSLSERASRWLDRVRVADPDQRLKAYPHQLSGGMRQRVVSAIGFAGEPEIILADEPTTSLDTTVQLQYLHLLEELQAETGVAIVFVTHDLGIVARICDRLAVMYAGQIVEQGVSTEVLEAPQHPYTSALIRSVPDLDEIPMRLPSIAGQPPAPGEIIRGCAFASRCDHTFDRCREEAPPEIAAIQGGSARCWLLEPTRGRA
jgi:oligopeptide/dipeptide ABC transporter ATP-binding protein